MNRSFALVVSTLGLVLALPAQSADANASKLDAIRSQHTEFAKVRDEMDQLMKGAGELKRGSDEQKAMTAKMGEVRKRMQPAQEAFEKAFKTVDWKQFDATKDGAVLKDGLVDIAFDQHEPAKAAEAGKFFLQHFGDDRAAMGIRSNALPMALLATGNVTEATAVLEEGIQKAEGPGKARMMLTLGDFHAAAGDSAKAAKHYEDAAAIADEGTKRYVTLRKELIGKPAPDIDSKTWIGGDAKALSAHKGKVVLVDFWATWCPPCRAVMPALNEMYKAHHKDGLEVLGVTRFYANGYMAANPEQMRTGGESVKGLTEATFGEHVTTFKKNTGIEYPFVIGVEQDFKNYHVAGIPTLAVVGRDGNIALITVGSGSEGLLKFAVKNLLAAKSEK